MKHFLEIIELRNRLILLIIITLAAPNGSEAQIVPLTRGRFYHPTDSIIYFVKNHEGMLRYVFRLKNEGYEIERSPNLYFGEGSPLGPSFHDNIAGRVYGSGFYSTDGGDHWLPDSFPIESSQGSPGENPGESFRIGGYNDGQRWHSILYSTQNSWQSWDTLDVEDTWDSHDRVILFTRKNGHLIRYLRDARTDLEFSSDTGRTWISGELENDTLPHSLSTENYVGTDDEFYTGYQGHLFYCIRDSGRHISRFFDFLDHGPYDYTDREGNTWDRGRIVTTNVAGEVYAIIDSSYGWNGIGVKMHIYHITDYGQHIEMISYNMPNFEPGAPEAVRRFESPIPAIPLFSVFPNPFNSLVTIHYSLPIPTIAKVTVEDIAGRRVAMLLEGGLNSPLQGRGSLTWDASNYPAGSYFVRLEAGGVVRTERVMLVK